MASNDRGGLLCFAPTEKPMATSKQRLVPSIGHLSISGCMRTPDSKLVSLVTGNISPNVTESITGLAGRKSRTRIQNAVYVLPPGTRLEQA